MAGTTTNFAIPYPSSSDYVTDGATAMRSIADRVDAVMFTGSSSGNLLINGAMQVNQRVQPVGTPVTLLSSSGYYTADRWRFGINLGTWTQTTVVDAPTGSGFRNSLKIQPTTAGTMAAGSLGYFTQAIEGQNCQAIRKGTASAQTLTVSFWVKAFQTGTYIVELNDYTNTRAVSKAYTITASATWQYVSIVFPADTTGALANSDAGALEISFWLAAGTNYSSGTLQTTWGALTSANRAVGQTNVASSTSNYWQMTGAQLTVGSVATPFEFKSYANDLQDCQRYYQIWSNSSNTSFMTIASSIYSTPMSLPVVMRTITSTNVTFVATIYGNGGSYSLNTLGVTVLESTRPQFFTLSGTFSGSWNYSWPLATFNTHTVVFNSEF
ncbi:hypothetical protein UFOVP1226_13 [uncultured Caudovirales phage]|uniref:Uncharacterized protein n=1 Tax=uncultured Caudovirales phage TaxID=2100421 RepID=A0A6J5RBD8_9CAUD|nr:hypothetical protein UFOVP278_29 [uncultured Caudovirales phage]CAB4191048.1 hypothetical protein UFOVP1226_13 [uncultured Caudovirales phage]